MIEAQRWKFAPGRRALQGAMRRLADSSLGSRLAVNVRDALRGESKGVVAGVEQRGAASDWFALLILGIREYPLPFLAAIFGVASLITAVGWRVVSLLA